MGNFFAMKKNLKSKIPLLLLLPLLWACGSQSGFTTSNVSYLYNSRELAPRPEFVVHHLSAEESDIYYRINSADLLYKKIKEEKQYQASFRISYEVVRSFENLEILDSGVVHVRDIADHPPAKALMGSFRIKTPTSIPVKTYVLRLVMTDEIRNVEFENFIRIDKTSRDQPGYFLLTDTAGNVIFKNHVPVEVPFRVTYSGGEADKFYMSVYQREFPLALPPYSSMQEESFKLQPDTTFVVDAHQNFVLPAHGFYHFRLDTTGWEGFTVYSFYDEFPFIAKRQHLGPPLRYLTTRREYEKFEEVMGDPARLKEQVDDFWINRTGSTERSRLLLQEYYNRVQEANIFFSSYLEGWKTDRGIIYTIYGPPDKVYRNSAGESWVYGDESSPLSYYFNFYKVSNPFTNNDYSLDRLSTYRYGWGQAIESWRNGHAYNSKDIKQEQNEQEQRRYRNRPPYWY